jgi:adenylate cyclase
MTAIAAPHARRAIELDPKLPQARLALAAIHRLEGNAVALLEELRAAQGLESNDPVVLRSIGWSYMTLGRPEEALEILERAHRSHPRDYRIVSSLVDCCAMLGRKEEEERLLGHIRELLFEALDRDPGNVDARGLLCIALAQSGERAAGIVQAEQVLAMAPGDGRVRYNTACAFVYAGLPERAIEQLRIMVGLVPSYLTDWVRKDPDLAPLRQHPEFVRMFGAA